MTFRSIFRVLGQNFGQTYGEAQIEAIFAQFVAILDPNFEDF